LQPAEDTVGTMWTFNKDKFSFSALPDTGAVKVCAAIRFEGVDTHALWCVDNRTSRANLTMASSPSLAYVALSCSALLFARAAWRILSIFDGCGVVQHVSGATYSDKGAVITPGSQKFDILLDLTVRTLAIAIALPGLHLSLLPAL
jgi:hypothetical protein